AREPARRGTCALHPALRRGQAEPALPPRLLHLRMECRAELRVAESRRPRRRGGDRCVVSAADLLVWICAALRGDPDPRRGGCAAARAPLDERRGHGAALLLRI